MPDGKKMREATSNLIAASVLHLLGAVTWTKHLLLRGKTPSKSVLEGHLSNIEDYPDTEAVWKDWRDPFTNDPECRHTDRQAY